jgi:drug/metabolite transporter (DMT)-like permease
MMAGRWMQTATSVTTGQFVSLFSILTLVVARFLAARGISVPGLLNLFFYVVLGMLCISYSWVRECKDVRQQRPGTPRTSLMDNLPATPIEAKIAFDAPRQAPEPPVKVAWWMYPLAALLDVEANYCAVRALAFANYTTVGLMLSLTIPFLSLLHYGINHRRHTWLHIIGCVIALTSTIPLFSDAYRFDYSDAKAEGGIASYQLYGTLLAFMAAFLYAASNIAAQWCLKERSLDGTIEATGFIAVCATVFSLIHFLVMEVSTASTIKWDSDIGICFVGYASAMITVYALVSYLMQSPASVTFVTSLFFSNLYLFATASYCFSEPATRFSAVALALILFGLGLHAFDSSSPASPPPSDISQKLNAAGFNSLSSPHPIAAIKLAAPHAVV